MAEKYYAFIKNNRVEDIIVFSEQNDNLANAICIEKEYDEVVWCDQTPPFKYAEYDGKNFIEPTHDYLFSIGVLNSMPTLIEENNNIE